MTRAVIICGSRDWRNAAPICAILDVLPADTIIITGGARGADGIAEDYYSVGEGRADSDRNHRFPADWDTHGKAAGPIRNRAMLDYLLTFDERHVYAFRTTPDSRGTNNMIEQARRAGVGVTVIDA